MGRLETLDVGQADKLKMAFRRTGWNNAEIDKLCEGDVLRKVRGVLGGWFEIRLTEHSINLDELAPDSVFTVEEHKKGGGLLWKPELVELHSLYGQKTEVVTGDDYRKEYTGKHTFNACLLEYLLAHSYLIPELWKGLRIFFWGTINRDPLNGNLYVRFLLWEDDKWQFRYHWLKNRMATSDVAALLVAA